MPFGASNLFMSFVYAEFSSFFFFKYLLRSFLNNNFSYKSTKFMTIFVVRLLVCRYVRACVYGWVCLLKLPWKFAVPAHTAHTLTYVCQTKRLHKEKYSILSENQSYDDNDRMLQSYTLNRLLSNSKQQNDVETRQNGINFPRKKNNKQR